MNLSERIRNFRSEKGFSQKELAEILGVRKITVLRWENSTSKPSPLAAGQLEKIGLGKIDPSDTKQSSSPRLWAKHKDFEELRNDIKRKIKIGEKKFNFTPSSYVINGPQDQIKFFEKLYQLQELKMLPCSPQEYVKRLSLVENVQSFNFSPAQYVLENPKLTTVHWNPNYGPHGWHRYLGRFPAHLVRSLLNHFGTKRGETICDPFVGSGTAMVESRLLGLKAKGIDICPLSCLISRTKSKFPISTNKLEKTLESLTDFYNVRWESYVTDNNFHSIQYEDIINRKDNLIPPFSNYKNWLTKEALLGCSLIIEFTQSLSGFEHDAVCCALSSRMRSIGNVDVDVARAEYRDKPRENVDVLRLVQRAIRKIISDINNCVLTHKDLISNPEDIQVINNSVLDTKFDEKSIDYIITSPPYGVESASYLRTHLLSYRCLQPILKHNPYSFDNKIIGSEYVLEEEITTENWAASEYSKTFNNFFSHTLGANLSTKHIKRKNMMMHFFNDMVKVAGLFNKWLSNSGKIAFIIGNKKIENYTIPTDNIIAEIFRSFDLHLDEIIKHKLKCNNSNSEVPWQERTIQDEYIMIFSFRG